MRRCQFSSSLLPRPIHLNLPISNRLLILSSSLRRHRIRLHSSSTPLTRLFHRSRPSRRLLHSRLHCPLNLTLPTVGSLILERQAAHHLFHRRLVVCRNPLRRHRRTHSMVAQLNLPKECLHLLDILQCRRHPRHSTACPRLILLDMCHGTCRLRVLQTRPPSRLPSLRRRPRTRTEDTIPATSRSFSSSSSSPVSMVCLHSRRRRNHCTLRRISLSDRPRLSPLRATRRSPRHPTVRTLYRRLLPRLRVLSPSLTILRSLCLTRLTMRSRERTLTRRRQLRPRAGKALFSPARSAPSMLRTLKAPRPRRCPAALLPVPLR